MPKADHLIMMWTSGTLHSL